MKLRKKIFIIQDGNINLDTYKITAKCVGNFINRETGISEPFNYPIDGCLSQDKSTFTGELTYELFGLVFDEKFIASKQ